MHVCKLIPQVARKGGFGGCSEGLSVSIYLELHAVNTNIMFLSVMHAPLKLERERVFKSRCKCKAVLT